jgi:hypothetical protein
MGHRITGLYEPLYNWLSTCRRVLKECSFNMSTLLRFCKVKKIMQVKKHLLLQGYKVVFTTEFTEEDGKPHVNW